MTERQNADHGLIEIVDKVIAGFDGEGDIKPTLVAALAMKEIDPQGKGPPLEQLGCNLHLRQLARERLRRLDPISDEATEPAQGKLYEDLQDRYPRRHRADDPDPAYAPREQLTAEDWTWNLARMNQDYKTRGRRRDAFKAWGEAKFGKMVA